MRAGEKLAQVRRAVALRMTYWCQTWWAPGTSLRQHDAFAGVGARINDAGFAEQGVVAFGDGAAGIVPAGDVLELDLEDGALKAIEPGVPADFVVMVAAAHSVLAEHAGAFGDLVVVGGDHAGVAGGAEVLGGIEAEGGGIAQRAGGLCRSIRLPRPGRRLR